MIDKASILKNYTIIANTKKEIEQNRSRQKEKLITECRNNNKRGEAEYVYLAKTQLTIIQQYTELLNTYNDIIENISGLMDDYTAESKNSIKNEAMSESITKKTENSLSMSNDIYLRNIMDNCFLTNNITKESYNIIDIYISDKNSDNRTKRITKILLALIEIVPGSNYLSLAKKIIDIIRDTELADLKKGKQISEAIYNEIEILFQIIVYFELFILILKNNQSIFEKDNEISTMNITDSEDVVKIITDNLNNRFGIHES